MTTPIFFTIEFKCPNCGVCQRYYNKENIICDYCCGDIKVKGELIE